MMILRTLVLATAMTCGMAMAQTNEPPTRNNAIVYKCTNADGSVIYAQEPCSSDPKKMQTLDTSGALRTGSGGHRNEIADSVADSDCRDNAYNSSRVSADRITVSNEHIATYRQQLEVLQSDANYGGGTADPAMRKAIDDLDGAIARESEFQQKEAANSDKAYQDALHACDVAAKSKK
jgi:hypothetical protein